MLSWEKLDQPEFDRIVELLILRWYKRERPELDVQAVDGRGGDGGIDIEVRESVTGKLLKIYQLKFFPEGFSGGHRSRRQQVRNSFEKAAALHPPVWALVIPRNFTIDERKWVTTLVKDSGIRAQFVGRTELDDMQADDPNAISLSQRTSDREALKLVGRESAAVLNMQDVAAEIMRTAARADTMSPNWGVEVSARGSRVESSLFAQHPRAQAREPLQIRLEADFTGQAELAKSLDESLKYGFVEPLVFPAGVITSLEHIGPSWFASLGLGVPEVVEMHPHPDASRALPVTLRVRASNGSSPRVLRGATELITGGEQGALVRTRFAGGLVITWKLDHDHTYGVSVTPAFHPEGEVATDVHRSLLALASIGGGSAIELEIDGQKTRLVAGPDASAFAITNEALELAEDLATIERESGAQFAFPSELVRIERLWIRVVRLLLDGECVLAPDIRSFDFRFRGNVDTTTEMLLTQSCAFLARHETWSAEICGETVVVGDVAYYHPGVEIPDSEAHLRALNAGTGANRPARVIAADPQIGFRIYSPSRMKSDAPIEPVPWGLRGVSEHSEFAGREDSG